MLVAPVTLPRALILALLAALVVSASAPAGVRLASRDEPVPAFSPSAGHARSTARVLPARTAPFRFNLVGLHWRGSGEVLFRTATATGRWSAWRDARPEAEDLPDRGTREAGRRAGWKLGNPYWTGAARRIQYRVTGRVVRLRAHFLWSAQRPAPPAARAVAAAVPARPAIITRANWGADESLVREKPSYADRVAFSVVHHTAGAKPTSASQSAAIVRGILAYHVRSNGWNDIGYNFLVDPFGQVFEGRAGGVARNVIGAHAQGFNTGSTGVAVLGTYESSTITAAARNALTDLLAWRLDLAHVDPASRLTRVSLGNPRFPAGTAVSLAAVSGHRDTGSTSCPGTALYGTLGRIAADTAARGAPKLFDPRAQGSPGAPIRFTGRLSAPLPWTVTVLDAGGGIVASSSGSGSAVDWTWDARSAPPGRYTYAIEAPDVRPARGTIGSAAGLALSSFAVKPKVVTPNGDGVTDVMTVTVGLSAAASLSAWLEDAGGARAATLATARPVAAGTTRLTWRGAGPGGAPVRDGRYRLVAEAVSGLERVSQTADVVVDRTLGRLVVRPAAFSPNGDGRRDTLRLGLDLTREAAVRVRVLAGSRTVATLADGRLAGGGRETISWDGRRGGSSVADGRYRAVVTATTSLGTRRLASAFVLDTARPRVTRLSARRSGAATVMRLRLSEPARLHIRLGSRKVTASRRAGTVSLRYRVRAARVTVVAQDAAGNRSRPVSARVR